MHGRQQNEKELRMINIVHHPFRGEETLRLTNNCLSPNLPVRRGDDDDVVVTDAPPPPTYPPNPNKRDLLLKLFGREQKRTNTLSTYTLQSAKL